MTRFTPDEIDEYNKTFSLFDKNKTGDVKGSELREMLKYIGFNPTDELLEYLTIVIDQDGNGRIDFEEFIALIGRLETEEKIDHEARAAFHAFDFMGEGFVLSRDLREALLYVMDTEPDFEKQKVIRYFKLDRNRKVYFEEFKKLTQVHRT